MGPQLQGSSAEPFFGSRNSANSSKMLRRSSENIAMLVLTFCEVVGWMLSSPVDDGWFHPRKHHLAQSFYQKAMFRGVV